MARTYSRMNGWSPPPHPLQVMAWIMVLCLTASTFGILSPAFASLTIRIAIHVVMAFMVFINILANIIVTTIDPADDAVKKKIRNNPRPGFDRDKHRHVIDENYFCNICETIIQPSSKHCRQCNKCVLDFDHHCKWLNNCIGEKNYRWFLFYIVSTSLTSVCILVLSVAVFTLQFVDRDSLYQIDGSLTIFGIQTRDAVWLTLVALSMAMAAVASILLMHLLIFHLRIIKKGMTTYNYIMEQRRKDEEKEKQKSDEAARAAAKAAASTLASGVKLFNQTKKTPVDDPSHLADHKANALSGHNVKIGKLTRLKKLLRWRIEQSQPNSQQGGQFPLPQQHKNGFLAQDGGPLGKRKQPQTEELVMVDTSSDNVKPGKEEQSQQRLPNLKTSENRSITPLPPIINGPNKMANGVRKSPAISSFIQTPTPANNLQSSARRKKRAGATSVQSPVPYEIMEDKENRISVSHIAATLPPDNPNKNRNVGRSDSAGLNAFSRHTDVPRLPPLASTANAHQSGNSNFLVSGVNPPGTESMIYRNVVSTDDLAASFASNKSTGDETLMEIPLASLPQRRQDSTPLGHPPPTTTHSQRTPSGSSTGSSGSILAPLQVDTLSRAVPSVDHVLPSHTYISGGRYFNQPLGQRMRPLPPLIAARRQDTHPTMTNDYDSRLSQFSDSGSVSSGSKRVRFSSSPKLRRK